jgi:hypothetical protein
MRSPAGQGGTWARAALALVAAVVAIAMVGCSSSSPPAYCTNRTNLENSVKGLTHLNVSSGISGLETQLKKIESDATSLVNSAKGDFPSQTSAITSSVDALKTAVAQVSSGPTAANIAALTTAAGGVVSSVKSFTDATSSKCGSS